MTDHSGPGDAARYPCRHWDEQPTLADLLDHLETHIKENPQP